MSKRPLKSNAEDMASLNFWLMENLTEKNSIIPHKQECNCKSKGIYFWFMKSNGYKVLSQHINMIPISNPGTIKKEIDGAQYNLVYLGTTGTGKSGKFNLEGRLKWHIYDKHSPNKINQKNSALSTLRTGIGSLLSNDLIIPNTEKIVNDFMKNYLKIYWIEYPDDKQLIDNDEITLIKELRPLLNLKNNPNSYKLADENPTKKYGSRRKLISTKTKLRIQKMKTLQG